MTDRPILFSGAMIRALLAGTKTQTRRVVKLPPGAVVEAWDGKTTPSFEGAIVCPYGVPGDSVLWVRETWQCHSTLNSDPIVHFRADASFKPVPIEPGTEVEFKGGWRPSIFMPRWASRITLEVTDVRVERLQAISVEDCIAEGLSTQLRENEAVCDLRDQYRDLWDSINATRAPWASNPWVWVVEFKRVEP